MSFTKILDESIGDFEIIAAYENDPRVIEIRAKKTTDSGSRRFFFTYVATNRLLKYPDTLKALLVVAVADQYEWLCNNVAPIKGSASG